ncbi:MAG: response regulator [Spirochaetota bacterium]
MKGPKTKDILSGRGLGVVAAFCVLLSGAAFLTHRSAYNRMETVLGSSLMIQISHQIEGRLRDKVEAGRRLASGLESNPQLSEAAIAAIAAAIMKDDETIVGVSVAPGAVVKLHFPLAQGDANIGHDLLSNPDRRESLARAAETREAVVAGPYESVEGARIGFIRYPVYDKGRLWGFASLTFDFDALYSSWGLEERFPDLKFGLYRGEGEGGGGSEEKVAPSSYKLAGDEIDGRDSHPKGAIDVFGLSWTLAAAPRTGWRLIDFSLYLLLALAALPSAALGLASLRKVPVEGKGPGSNSLAGVPELPPLEPSEERRPESLDILPQDILPLEAEGEGGFLDFEEMARKKGRKLRFRGPSVKGALYMPEKAALEEAETQGAVAAPEEKTEKAVAEAPTDSQALADLVVLPARDKARAQRPAQAARPKAAEPSSLGPLFQGEDSALTSPQAVSAPAGERPPSILVVDDSEVNRDLVGRMLGLKGLSADFADSGSSALEKCKANAYDVVFMDCFMPGMDGYKTSQSIRRDLPGKGMKIIGMSARLGEKERENCLASGMDDVLAKPFTSKQLGESLEKNLSPGT